jgi:hypothetical protein
VQRAPGIPCALYSYEGARDAKLGRECVARTRTRVDVIARSERDEAIQTRMRSAGLLRSARNDGENWLSEIWNRIYPDSSWPGLSRPSTSSARDFYRRDRPNPDLWRQSFEPSRRAGQCLIFSSRCRVGSQDVDGRDKPGRDALKPAPRLRNLHTRPRVQLAPGIPCALALSRVGQI